MSNAQQVRDRYTEALVKSVIDFLTLDLGAAWGGNGVEVVAGNPDIDYDLRRKQDGTSEKRDLKVKPFLVVTPLDQQTRAWAISPRGDEMERASTLRIDAMAATHFDVLTLLDTLQSVIDGAADSTSGISLKDPDVGSPLGYIFPDTGAPPAAVWSGPGDNSQDGVSLPTGKAQYENMKHRGSVLVAFTRAKRRGSKVI